MQTFAIRTRASNPCVLPVPVLQGACAYLSLIRNLPYLFVYQDYKELNIPNTTNVLDGQFANLKNKLRNHNGLSKVRKMRFIDEFLRHNVLKK